MRALTGASNTSTGSGARAATVATGATGLAAAGCGGSSPCIFIQYAPTPRPIPATTRTTAAAPIIRSLRPAGRAVVPGRLGAGTGAGAFGAGRRASAAAASLSRAASFAAASARSASTRPLQRGLLRRGLLRRGLLRRAASHGLLPAWRLRARLPPGQLASLAAACCRAAVCSPGRFGRGSLGERFHFRGRQIARGIHQRFSSGHRCGRLRRGARPAVGCVRRLAEKRLKDLPARRAQGAILARPAAALAADGGCCRRCGRGRKRDRRGFDGRGADRHRIDRRQIDRRELVRRWFGRRRTGAAGISSPRLSSSESLRPQHSQKCPGVIGSVTHSMQRKTVPPAGAPPGGPSAKGQGRCQRGRLALRGISRDLHTRRRATYKLRHPFACVR